jgi:hypothetical protein
MKKDALVESDMTDAEFIIYLKQKFNVQNFFFCFQYMKDYVDFDGSSDRGRWYMQSIFVNLSLATWRWILKGKIPKGADRDHLLDAYDALALNPKHDDIVLDDFCQLTQRYRNQRERKKRDFSQVNSEFVDVDEMPSKMIPRTFADRRLRPIDDIDNDIDNELDSEEDEPEFELNRILAG